MDQLEIIVSKESNGFLEVVDTPIVQRPAGPTFAGLARAWMGGPIQIWRDLPDAKVFHTVITDQEAVRSAQSVLSGAREAPSSGMTWHQPIYVYYLRFADDDMTTLIYSGKSSDRAWGLSDMVASKFVVRPTDPPLSDIFIALHDQFGMPYWLSADSDVYVPAGGVYRHVTVADES
jgi:hypothetical protein